MRYRILTAAAIVATAGLAAVSVQGATPAQFGAKCKAAWTGPTSGGAFGAYQSKCVIAATNATNKATDAGNPTDKAANTKRANAACAAQFKPPRNTAAKRKAYAACVKAAIASQVAFAGRPLTATLAGANEVPAAGGATGSASIRLNQGQKRVCYTLKISGLAGAGVTAAHIHQGAAGASGPPIVALSNAFSLTDGGTVTGCETNVPANTIKQIRQNPAGYYVNVHTQAFPDGAARGQLTK